LLYSSFCMPQLGCSRQSNRFSTVLMPIIMPLILSVYVGFFTVINDPHGTVAVVFFQWLKALRP
jgi:ABC-2 type transport system permease protein